MATGTDEEETPLLELQVDGSVDYEGRPILKSYAGGWRSAAFIIGVEVAERFSYYGIASNLITFLTGSLGESTATAAENVNLWSGVSTLLPLLGGFVADSFFGRYRTIVISSIIYISGLGLLCLLAVLTSGSSYSNIYVILFYFALYLVAIGQGGHKPCVQAFGADQFDGKDPEESKSKSSFFNWWYFSSNVGILVTFSILVYIQDTLSWAFGFGIPCIVMVASLFIFLLGTRTYRYSAKTNKKHPFMRIGRVFVAAVRNRKITPLTKAPEEEGCGSMPPYLSQQFKCLDKALLTTDGFMDDEKVCSAGEVEESKAVLRLIPIWVSCLGYAVVFAQCSTFFTKQGVTMDRTITSDFRIPAASLQSFICIAIILIVPLYDRIFIRVLSARTMKPSGVTMLQRIGIGMVLSAISMVIAALVEMKRLKTAEENGLVNKPNATIPMSIWWLVPQYILFGAADVFTMVGLQEFFYDQVPVELRSIGLSLYLSIFGVGSILSSLLISAIDKVSNSTWFNDNLNRAHLDYFYWLLAGLSAVGLASFLYFAKSYIYKRESTR